MRPCSRDFLQKAAHAFVVMLDNQNTVPEWAADTLCRLVTGEADSKRRLYTDDGDVMIELRRVVLLNRINVPTDRGDVLDRSLVVELERILDGERRTEEALWESFEAEHPKQGYVAASSKLHKKLGAVAAELGVGRDKACPKSTTWLWKRVKEVLPVLAASGIVAGRIEDKQGNRIALRKTSTDAATSATESENRIDKPKNGGSKEDVPATASATEEDATITPATEEERFYKESGSNGSSGSKSGDSSDGTRLRVFLEDPPEWFRTQARLCIQEGAPDRLLNPLANAVSIEVFGTPWRWREALPLVKKRRLEEEVKPAAHQLIEETESDDKP